MKYVEKIDSNVLLKGKLCGDDITINEKYNYLEIDSTSKLSVVLKDTDDGSSRVIPVKELAESILHNKIGHIVNAWVFLHQIILLITLICFQ